MADPVQEMNGPWLEDTFTFVEDVLIATRACLAAVKHPWQVKLVSDLLDEYDTLLEVAREGTDEFKRPLRNALQVVVQYEDEMREYVRDPVNNRDYENAEEGKTIEGLGGAFNQLKTYLQTAANNPLEIPRNQVAQLSDRMVLPSDMPALPRRALIYMWPKLRQIRDPEQMKLYLLSAMVVLGGAKKADKLFMERVNEIAPLPDLDDPIHYLLDGRDRDGFLRAYGNIRAVPGVEQTVAAMVRIVDSHPDNSYEPDPVLEAYLSSNESYLPTLLIAYCFNYLRAQLVRSIVNINTRRTVWKSVTQLMWPAMELMGLGDGPFHFGGALLATEGFVDVVGLAEPVPVPGKGDVPTPLPIPPPAIVPPSIPVPAAASRLGDEFEDDDPLSGESIVEAFDLLVEAGSRLFGWATQGPGRDLTITATVASLSNYYSPKLMAPLGWFSDNSTILQFESCGYTSCGFVEFGKGRGLSIGILLILMGGLTILSVFTALLADKQRGIYETGNVDGGLALARATRSLTERLTDEAGRIDRFGRVVLDEFAQSTTASRIDTLSKFGLNAVGLKEPRQAVSALINNSLRFVFKGQWYRIALQVLGFPVLLPVVGSLAFSAATSSLSGTELLTGLLDIFKFKFAEKVAGVLLELVLRASGVGLAVTAFSFIDWERAWLGRKWYMLTISTSFLTFFSTLPLFYLWANQFDNVITTNEGKYSISLDYDPRYGPESLFSMVGISSANEVLETLSRFSLLLVQFNLVSTISPYLWGGSSGASRIADTLEPAEIAPSDAPARRPLDQAIALRNTIVILADQARSAEGDILSGLVQQIEQQYEELEDFLLALDNSREFLSSQDKRLFSALSADSIDALTLVRQLVDGAASSGAARDARAALNKTNANIATMEDIVVAIREQSTGVSRTLRSDVDQELQRMSASIEAAREARLESLDLLSALYDRFVTSQLIIFAILDRAARDGDNVSPSALPGLLIPLE
jgi:hypothetical protein